MTRLEAMRAVMLGRSPAPTAPVTSRDVGMMLGQLRAALAVERRARLQAEARLKAVLDEIARRRPAPRPMVEPRQLPAAPLEPEVIEGEVITSQEAIMDLGGDEWEEEDDNG